MSLILWAAILAVNCTHSGFTYKSDGPWGCCSWDGASVKSHVDRMNKAMRKSICHGIWDELWDTHTESSDICTTSSKLMGD